MSTGAPHGPWGHSHFLGGVPFSFLGGGFHIRWVSQCPERSPFFWGGGSPLSLGGGSLLSSRFQFFLEGGRGSFPLGSKLLAVWGSLCSWGGGGPHFPGGGGLPLRIHSAPCCSRGGGGMGGGIPRVHKGSPLSFWGLHYPGAGVPIFLGGGSPSSLGIPHSSKVRRGFYFSGGGGEEKEGKSSLGSSSCFWGSHFLGGGGGNPPPLGFSVSIYFFGGGGVP